jgi:hypothetical protein
MTEKKGAKAPNKNEAVYLALQELGTDAERGQILSFVKERFGIEMTPNHVSSAKTTALKKLGVNGKPVSKAKPPAPKKAARVDEAAPVATPAREKSSPAGGTAVELDDLLALKALVGRVGAETLRKLIDVVG